MKLPDPVSTRVQSLGRYNTNLPWRVANAWSRAFGNIGESAMMIAKEVQAHHDKEVKFQKDQYLLGMSKAKTDFFAKWDDKIEIPVSEIPEGVEVDVPEGATSVPMTKVKAQMFKVHMLDQADLQAASITDADVRKEQVVGQRDAIERMYLMQLRQDMVDQERHDASLIELNIKQAEAEGRWEDAIFANDNNEFILDDVRAARDRAIRTDWEVSNYSEMLDSDDLVTLKTGLDSLVTKEGKPNPNLLMGPIQAQHTAHAFRTRIRQIENRRKAERATRVTRANKKATKYTKMLIRGEYIDPQKLTMVLTDLRANGGIEEAEELQLAWKYRDFAREVSHAPASAQREAVRRFRRANKGNPDILFYAKDLEAEVENNIKDMQDDTTSYTARVLGVDLEPLDPQNPLEGITKRMELVHAGKAMFGITQGPLTKAEAEEWTFKLNSGGAKQALDMFGKAEKELGRDGSSILFKQMQKSGMAGPWAKAGELHSAGETGLAMRIMHGSGLMKDLGKDYNKTVRKLKTMITEEIGNSYGYDMVQSDQVLNAAVALVTQMNGGSEEPSKSDVEDAVEAITGGLIEFGGTRFPAPTRGMTEGTLEKNIKALHWMELVEQGYSEEDAKYVWSKLIEGKWGFAPSPEQGKYLLVMSDTGDKYYPKMFEFRESPMTREKWAKIENTKRVAAYEANIQAGLMMGETDPTKLAPTLGERAVNMAVKGEEMLEKGVKATSSVLEKGTVTASEYMQDKAFESTQSFIGTMEEVQNALYRGKISIRETLDAVDVTIAKVEKIAKDFPDKAIQMYQVLDMVLTDISIDGKWDKAPIRRRQQKVGVHIGNLRVGSGNQG